MPQSVDPERLLLSWCLQHQDILPIIEADLIPDDFDDPAHAEILAWALDHYSKHNVSPGVDALRLHNPNWRLENPTDLPDVYIEDIKSRIKYNIVRDTLQDAKDALDGDDEEKAAAILSRGVADLQDAPGNALDEDITLNTSPRYTMYQEFRKNPGALRGMATGFHTVDRATGGIQHGQFVVLGGIQKSGKSTCLMKMGENFNRQGKHALLISFEMSAQEQKARWDAMWAKVNYRKLLDGRTSIEDMERIRRAHQRMEDGFPFTLSTDIGRVTTVSGIAAKIARHQPDIVLVDGIYLMLDDSGESPGSPQALTNITRDFKRLAQKSVPIIGTTQASEAKTTRSRGITAFSFSWSQSFGQDADALIGLQPADEEDDKAAEIRVLESRHGPKVRAELIWDWNTMEFEERWEVDDAAIDGTASVTGGF